MRLQPNLLLLPLDDEVVAFSEEAQCLLALNASAAFVVGELQAGVPASEIANVFVTEGLATKAEAEHWVSSTIEAIQANGLDLDTAAKEMGPPGKRERRALRRRAAWKDMKAAIPPFEPSEALIEKRYQLLGACVLVRYADLRQVKWAEAIIGHLVAEEGAEPNAIVDVQIASSIDNDLASDIYCNGRSFGSASRLDRLAPMVNGALWNEALKRHKFFLNIHAGVVETGGACIVLPAPAGSGKSSLVTALVHKGFRFFSDEVALFEPDSFRVPPFPMGLCSKSTGWDAIAPYYREVNSVPVHERMDGKLIRYLLSPAIASSKLRDSLPVKCLIFPRYKEGASTRLKTIARTDAVHRLTIECLQYRQRLNEENVRGLLSWISGVACYALTFSSLDKAVDLIAKEVGLKESSSV